MLSPLENPMDEIMDEAMDNAMEHYITDEEYRKTDTAINEWIAGFRSNLSPLQQKEFNHLIDALSNAHADFSYKAFVCGVKYGIERGKRHSSQ